MVRKVTPVRQSVIAPFDLETEPTRAGFSLGSFHGRALAVSAGDMRVAVNREVHRLLAEAGGNPLQAARAGLKHLLSHNLITLQDQKVLSEICETVFASQRRKLTGEAAFAKVRTLYDQLLIDTTASPVALAIASSAASGWASAPSSGSTRTAKAPSYGGDIGMVGGAIGGAIVGGAIGGAGGAIIGAVIGGIAAGIAGACAAD